MLLKQEELERIAELLNVARFDETEDYQAAGVLIRRLQNDTPLSQQAETAPAQDELLSGFCQWYRGKKGYAPLYPRGSEGAEAFAAGAEWQRTRAVLKTTQPSK